MEETLACFRWRWPWFGDCLHRQSSAGPPASTTHTPASRGSNPTCLGTLCTRYWNGLSNIRHCASFFILYTLYFILYTLYYPTSDTAHPGSRSTCAAAVTACSCQIAPPANASPTPPRASPVCRQKLFNSDTRRNCLLNRIAPRPTPSYQARST